jgi:hypothetical protein
MAICYLENKACHEALANATTPPPAIYDVKYYVLAGLAGIVAGMVAGRQGGH